MLGKFNFSIFNVQSSIPWGLINLSKVVGLFSHPKPLPRTQYRNC